MADIMAKLNRTFDFQPRWKEELVVSGPGGSFVLELPMGVYSTYLPTKEAWATKGPEWARSLWSPLKTELGNWCKANGAELHIDATASVSIEE